MLIQDPSTSAVIGEVAGTVKSLIVQPRPYNQSGLGEGGGGHSCTIQGVVGGNPFGSGDAAGTPFVFILNGLQSNAIFNFNRLYAWHEQRANISIGGTQEQVFDFFKTPFDKVNPNSPQTFARTLMRTSQMNTLRQPDNTGAIIDGNKRELFAAFPVMIQATAPTGSTGECWWRMNIINDQFGSGPIQMGFNEMLEVKTRFTSPLGANTSFLFLCFNMTISYGY